MAIVTAERATPTSDDLVTMRLTGDLAVAFVELLNMNKIRNGQGHLIQFDLSRTGDDWCLTETVFTDR